MQDKLYEGRCIGGPLHGREMVSRFPKGLLLVHKPAEMCWLYDWDDSQKVFRVRVDSAGGIWRDLDTAKRLQAAEEFDYDVVAMP